MKLGKIEKKILIALLKKRKGTEYTNYPEGNNQKGIAKIAFNRDVLKYRKYLKKSIRSSLSRALNRLWRKKGLVDKCKPIFSEKWVLSDPEDESSGYYSRKVCGLKVLDPRKKVVGLNSKVVPKVKKTIRFTELYTGLYGNTNVYDKTLPSNTKVWWRLTEKGKKIAKKLKEESEIKKDL